MRSARIELRNVTKQFGDVRAVDGVSFTVEPGCLATLVGPSGCGKTTTLRLVAGLDFPSAGDILIGDTDVSALAPAERNVAMVFPTSTFFRHLTVAQNIGYGVPSERGREMLNAVGLAGLETRLPAELSAGQQQRAAVARALVLEPAVLLFDEPLSSLDAGLRRHVRDEIRDLQQRLGFTVLYVTHDHGEALAVSDHVIVMNRGAIAQQGPPRTLYEAPDSAFVAGFLGANHVAARLVARDGELGIVQLGVLQLRLPHRDAPLGPVNIAIRPESIVVGPPRPEGLAASVTKVAYLGAAIEYTLSTEHGLMLAIDRDTQMPLKRGDEASVTLRDRGVVIIPHA